MDPTSLLLLVHPLLAAATWGLRDEINKQTERIKGDVWGKERPRGVIQE